MAKVQQVATWVNAAGMYAIVNTHHDADGQWILFDVGKSLAPIGHD